MSRQSEPLPGGSGFGCRRIKGSNHDLFDSSTLNPENMKITFLGTGTSQGVPILNCTCAVCSSDDPRNNRLRTSISLQTKETTLLVDTTPDLRQQLLRNPIARLDAVFYTHAHADHIYGIDELRRFNQLQKERIPVFADPFTLSRLTHLFDYAFGNGQLLPGIPNLEAREIRGPLQIGDIQITPIRLLHGMQEILGFRFGDFAYCTDVSKIPEASYNLLKNLKVLVLDALRETPHPTHFNVDEALIEAKKISAEKTYFIHMSHKIDHETRSRTLPAGIEFAFDGLVVETGKT
jgi:phosphoribosyl 1,2-cyclic phosphate phosphodiesterase